MRVILVMMASIIFSPFVGYGFFWCSCSQAFRVLVVSRVAFLRREAPSVQEYLSQIRTIRIIFSCKCVTFSGMKGLPHF